MTDQIAKLRALLADEKVKYRRHKMEPSRDSWVQHHNAEYALQQAAVEHLPALLDCAEALIQVTATLEWRAHGICRATDGLIMSSADAVAMGKNALARLNGEPK